MEINKYLYILLLIAKSLVVNLNISANNHLSLLSRVLFTVIYNIKLANELHL